MKTTALALLLLLLMAALMPCALAEDEMIPITAFDGKLRMPDSGEADALILYVNGSGPNTYDNKKQYEEQTFNYFDLFAQACREEGIAFFSYNTRGVTPSDDAPSYYQIDDALYQTYLPQNTVRDVEAMIRTLKAREGLQDAKVYLLGWSEGAMVAPEVARQNNVQVDGLLLCGYPNDTMEETLLWQQTGGNLMLMFREYFEADAQGSITREAYEADPNGVKAFFGTFEENDADGDGLITGEDMALLLADTREQVLSAFENGDDAWLRENYGVPLTSAWYQAHKDFPPAWDVLPELDLPIYIFQGAMDLNTPAEGTREIERVFEALGKDNLHARIFPGHDHDLNYMLYIADGAISEGLQALLDTFGEIAKGSL